MQKVASQIGGNPILIEDLKNRSVTVDIVINATSVSSHDEAPELAALVSGLDVQECELVLDLNYGRRTNFWQEMADARGIRFMNGLSTLAHQARRCFSLWTRIDVEPEEFKKALGEEV